MEVGELTLLTVSATLLIQIGLTIIPPENFVPDSRHSRTGSVDRALGVDAGETFDHV